MTVTHKLTITAQCPVNDTHDVYTCVVTTDRVIKVEDILSLTKPYADQKIFQEDLCQELHKKLKCRVQLTGVHSGVETDVVCE